MARPDDRQLQLDRETLIEDIEAWSETEGGPAVVAPPTEMLAPIIVDTGLDPEELDSERQAFVDAFNRGADEPELDRYAWQLGVDKALLVQQVQHASRDQIAEYIAHREQIIASE